MGNLSGLSCPYCGAPLVPAKKGNTKCEYCGSVVTSSISLNINDVRQFGQEFELGRYAAQKTIPGLDLAAQIRELIQPVEELSQTHAHIKELKGKMDAAQTELDKFRDSGKAKFLWFPLLVLFLTGALSESGKILSPLPIFLGLLAFAYLFLVRKGKTNRLEKAFSACVEKHQDACNHLEELYRTYDFDLIPEEYRSKQPMMFFIKVLNNGRALSLREAINLYEEDLHRKEVLKLKAEQNKLQAEQNELQRQRLKEEQEFHEQQLEMAKQKKGVDWGTVLTAAGSVAAVALSVKRKKKWF